MQTNPTAHRDATRSTTQGRALDLDALASMDTAALAALYEGGKLAPTMAALDGHPRGRMLAVRSLDRGPIASALRALAGARAFPWGGKSFAATGAATGTGSNRVALGGRHALFPFLTRIGPSVIDGAPAVILDYDLPDNPGVIRAIHDEVRLVDEGLWLGPAMWKNEAAPALVLWFALDTTRQEAAVGHPRGEP